MRFNKFLRAISEKQTHITCHKKKIDENRYQNEKSSYYNNAVTSLHKKFSIRLANEVK